MQNLLICSTSVAIACGPAFLLLPTDVTPASFTGLTQSSVRETQLTPSCNVAHPTCWSLGLGILHSSVPYCCFHFACICMLASHFWFDIKHSPFYVPNQKKGMTFSFQISLGSQDSTLAATMKLTLKCAPSGDGGAPVHIGPAEVCGP